MPLLYGDLGHQWSPEEVQGLRKRFFENVGDLNFKFKTLNIWTILTFSHLVHIVQHPPQGETKYINNGDRSSYSE